MANSKGAIGGSTVLHVAGDETFVGLHFMIILQTHVSFQEDFIVFCSSLSIQGRRVLQSEIIKDIGEWLNIHFSGQVQSCSHSHQTEQP